MSAAADRYKWIALSNTTIGVLMVTISGSITIISLPDIFRGIRRPRGAPALALAPVVSSPSGQGGS